MSKAVSRAFIVEAVRQAGGIWLAVTREDGAEDTVAPEINADGTWSYLVPEGVTTAGGSPVQTGDTVSGKIEVSPW
jgi:hypothetical protein